MKKSILLICLVFLLVLNIYGDNGKGVLTGKIVDKKTNEPIPNVKVEILNKDITVVTDSEGIYKVEISTGFYDMRFNHPEYYWIIS